MLLEGNLRSVLQSYATLVLERVMASAEEILARKLQASSQKLAEVIEENKAEEAEEEEQEGDPIEVGDEVHLPHNFTRLYVTKIFDSKDRGSLVDVIYFDGMGRLQEKFNVPEVLLEFWNEDADEEEAVFVERADI